jgi:hypothetical protein
VRRAAFSSTVETTSVKLHAARPPAATNRRAMTINSLLRAASASS